MSVSKQYVQTEWYFDCLKILLIEMDSFGIYRKYNFIAMQR